MPGKRVTAGESTMRTQEVYGLLCRGFARQQIIQSVSGWGLSDRQIDAYIAKARELIEQDCDLSRPAFLAECLANVREIQQAAFKRGQLMCALNAVKLASELTGITPK
jgi:hypothetical protein